MLAQGGGRYRCGKCQKVGNALEALFDEWPDAKDEGVRPGELPVLGIALSKKKPAADLTPEEAAAADSEADEDPAPRPQRRWLRFAWITVAVALAFVIAIQLGNFFGNPFPDRAAVEKVLIESGIKEAPPTPLFRAPDLIELVSREIKPHPLRAGVLLLTATVVNRAAEQQAYPDIDVTLLDVRGQRLSRQLFHPGDYLKRSSELRTGMPPEAYLAVEIEIIDPGENATGFELQFR